jgi:hypothetical protein
MGHDRGRTHDSPNGKQVRNSGWQSSVLIEVGTDHRLADPEPLEAMLRACEEMREEQEMSV